MNSQEQNKSVFETAYRQVEELKMLIVELQMALNTHMRPVVLHDDPHLTYVLRQSLNVISWLINRPAQLMTDRHEMYQHLYPVLRMSELVLTNKAKQPLGKIMQTINYFVSNDHRDIDEVISISQLVLTSEVEAIEADGRNFYDEITTLDIEEKYQSLDELANRIYKTGGNDVIADLTMIMRYLTTRVDDQELSGLALVQMHQLIIDVGHATTH